MGRAAANGIVRTPPDTSSSSPRPDTSLRARAPIKHAEQQTLAEALRGFSTLMVATHAPNGTMHARPMMIARVDDSCDVWFVTERESGKVDEVCADATALVTGQGPRRYVSLSGHVDLVDDPELALRLTKSPVDQWLKGLSDGGATVLRFRPSIGEYWLAPGLKGARYLFEATRAMLTQSPSKEDLLEHAKVVLIP
jgi:general stress protein 26